jgi:preprotein translocase subunit SecB
MIANVKINQETGQMTDTSNNGSNEAAAQGPQPSLRVMAQYIKDLSFENPNAPQSLGEGKAPEIAVSVNVNARPLGGSDFEVELKLEAKGSHGEKAAFMVELAYGGVFRIENMPQDVMQPLMLIECPRLLFPFARQILADATRNGGFPPLMLEPIDFGQIYQRRLQAAATGAA